MDELSVLDPIAEIAIALAGFSGLVATFQQRSDVEPNSADIVGLTMILVMGLGVAFFSLLPTLLFSFELAVSVVWLISNSLAAAFMLLMTNFIRVNLLKAVNRRKTRALFITLISVAFLICILLVLSAFSYTPFPQIGVFLLALLFGLAVVGYSFCRLLLLPLWRRKSTVG